MARTLFGIFFVSIVVVLVGAGCSNEPAPGSTYFDRHIAPILKSSCEQSVAPCHRDDGNGVALGNLDVSSFEALQQRRDVLRRYGAFPEPLLLIKAVGSAQLDVHYDGEFYPLEIVHAGGPILQPGGNAYLTLKTWLDNGATNNGIPPASTGGAGTGPCSTAIPGGVDPATVADDDPGFPEFASVQSLLVDSCAAGSCHGSARADYHLTCGSTDEQTRANYLMTRAFVAAEVNDSPLLVKVLDPTIGGDYHNGGAFFDSRSDADYVELSEWAMLAGPLPPGDRSPARLFFDEQVMPILLQRGCALESCHSPIVPFKENLRAGSLSFFSPLAKNTNYKVVRKFLGLGSPHPLASRVVAKNTFPAKGGILHRAGSVLEAAGNPGDPLACPQPYDPDNATPLCTIAQWRRLERSELPARYISDMAAGSTAPLVYVERPPDAVRSIVDFSAYRPGADLVRADALFGADASVESVSGATSLIGSCPGVGATRDDVDVRAPEPSHDATRVVFGMRIGASGGLDLYEVGVDGSGCRQLTTDGGQIANGIKIESFDPYYVTDDDGVEWVVYSSSRGGPDGPTRTPKLFLPGADLWRQPLAGGTAEQLTFLSGVEAQAFGMNNGMMAMVVEKASPEFYQFGARRLNWDRSDYHPLLGQRKQSFQGRNGYLPGEVPPDAVQIDSIGYSQITEFRSAYNGDFLIVLSDTGSYGEGGALGIFNRSVGPFEQGRNDPAFVKSLMIMPGPTGRAGEATGAYRSPYPLPDTSILASYAPGADVGDPGTAKRYELVVVDRVTGERRTLRSDTASLVEAVLVVPRPPPKTFVRKPSTEVASESDYAILHYTDLPLLATLQGANDRRGRLVETLRGATEVRYFTRESPPSSCTTPAACSGSLEGSEQVYVSRVELGSAPVAEDGSAFIRVPADTPVFLELLDDNGNILFRMQEETQFGPFENINLAVPESAYHTLCAICHGSISGRELEVTFELDVLTTASQSIARSAGIVDLQ